MNQDTSGKYTSLVPSEKDSSKQQPTLFTREFFWFIGHFVQFATAIFIVVFVGGWLEQITGLHPLVLVGITCILIGCVQLGWSYVTVPNK